MITYNKKDKEEILIGIYQRLYLKSWKYQHTQISPLLETLSDKKPKEKTKR